MSYIEKTLLPGEDIIIYERMSGKCFIPTIAYGILAIGVMVAGFFFDSDSRFIIVIIGIIMLIGFIYRLLRLFIWKISSEFAITNKRCIIRTGLIRINVADLNLDKCEGLTFSQTIWGRMLNFGTLFVSTGGMSNSFFGANEPCQIRNRANEIIEKYKKEI